MKESSGRELLAIILAALLIGSVFVGAFSMSQFVYAEEAGDPAAPDNTNSTSTSSNSTSTASNNTSTSPPPSNETSSSPPPTNSTESTGSDTPTPDSSAAAADNSTGIEPSPPTLSSDKGDYSPGETAYIQGSNFGSESSYDLYVFRGDGWIVKSNGEAGYDTIVTDADGNFDYFYELPSVNGEWMVVMYESPDTELINVVASLNFEVNAPTLSTDKFDYEPSDTVSVSGKGFKASESYDVVIERPDGSIIKGDGTFTDGYDSVNANSQGRFTYSYILNGIPGAYQIYVFRSLDESHDELIARGGFADANTGPRYGGTATSSTWSNPINAQGASDNVCASSGSNNAILDITNFGFTSAMIPAGAVITSIKVEVDTAAMNSANRQLNVQLLKAGAVIAGSNVFTFNPVDGGANPCALLPVDNFVTMSPASPTWNAGLTPADLTATGFGVRLQNANGGAARVVDSVRVTIAFETSISWEKRLETTGTPLNGPATFEVSPDPSDNIGIMTVTDNGAFDTDLDIGQLTVSTVQLATFTITEITPTTGTALDDDVTREIIVSTSELNPVVGVQGADNSGNTDESDFHNRLGTIEWEKRLESTGALQSGATFSISPDPSDGVGTMTVVDNGANDADSDGGQLKVNDARLTSYTITETVAPAGTMLDDDATRAIVVSAGDLNAVVGSALGTPPGTDDSGNTDESDFHNIPVTVSVTFNASPAMADVAGTTAVLTVTIGGGSPVTVLKSELPRTFTGITSGTTVSYSYDSPLASTTAGKQYAWSSTAGTGSASGVTGQSDSFAITSTSTVTATYQAQFQVVFQEAGLNGADATDTVVTVSGTPKTFGDLPFTTAFVNSGTVITFDYSDPVTSSVAGKQYRLSGITGGSEPSVTVSAPTTITGNYVEQFRVMFQQTGLNGADATGTVVTVDSSAKTFGLLPFSKFVDSGTVVSFDYGDPVTSSVTGKQYRLASITGGSEPSVTVSAPTTITGNYVEQFLVLFEESGLDGSATGTLVTVDSIAQTSLPFSKFVDTGSSVSYLYEDPVDSNASDKQFRLTSVTGPTSPISVTSPTTVTGNYIKQFLVEFQQTGLGSDSTGTVVVVDGDSKLRTDLPFSKFVDTGSSVTFDYSDPVTSSIAGKQYGLSSITGGAEPSVTVTMGTTIIGNYIDQFRVTFTHTGLDSSATGTVVTVDSSGKTFGQLPFSKFVDSGTTVTFDYNDPLSSSDVDRQFVLTSISGGSEPSVVVTADTTVIGNYQSQHKLTFAATGLDGTANTVVVTVDGADQSVGDLPFKTAFIDDGSSVTFDYKDPVGSSDADRQFRLDSVTHISPITVTTAETITGDYQSQHLVRFDHTGLDSSATGTVVTVDGDAKSFGQLQFSKFVDDGETVSYTYNDPVSSSIADKRFRLAGVTGPSSSFTVSGPVTIVGNYIVQYRVTFTQTGMDGTATSTVVTVNGSPNNFGDLPLTDWFDAGSTYAYSDPVSSSSPGSSFILLSVSGQASPISTSGTVTGNYFKTIVISGMKFNDVNGNGVKDGADDGLSGWTIELDKDANGSNEQSATTGAGGTYSFTNLGPGTYRIREVLQTGWTQTTVNPSDVTAVSGTNVADVNFGNFENIAISGMKFEDENGDGLKTGDSGLEDWTIQLLDTDDNLLDDTTTASDGTYSFADLGPGTYRVREVAQSGWTQTTADPVDIPAISGDDVSDIDFGNFENIAISGMKFEDHDGDGVQDAEDQGLEGWTIQLDIDADGTVDDTTATDSNGEYSFADLGPDTYRIREVVEPDWTQTTDDPLDIIPSSGVDETGVDFGNFQLFDITGKKFEDHNGDGIEDSGDQGLEDWTINLEKEGLPFATTMTISDGEYSFTDLGPGEYVISETLESGWTQTYPSSPGTHSFVGSSGIDATDKDFGNFENIAISGMKFEDLNGNGAKDLDEPGLEGWTINLSGASTDSTSTDADGLYSFADLGPGSYTISEDVELDWTQTYPATPGTYTFAAASGEDVPNQDFGNFQLFDISGYKYDDINGDGDLTDGVGLSGWTIYLDMDGSTAKDAGEPFAVTDGNGKYTITDLGPSALGKKVREELQSDYVQTASPADNPISTTSGQDLTTGLDFGNFQLFDISGKKFEDKNGNGLEDSGDDGLTVWTIKLAKNGSPYATTTTGSGGTYSFSNLGPGQYTISEDLQPGWTQTYPVTPGTHTFNGASGVDVPNKKFGNFKNIMISGQKFEDLDGDKIKDAGDVGLPGWTIFLDTNNNGAKDSGEPFTTTDGSGNYQFTNLGPGTYYVREVLQTGWHQTLPEKFPTAPGKYTVVATSGTNVVSQDFGNIKARTIQGFFSPIDMNGVVNNIKAGQAVPAKFKVFIGGTQQTSLSEIFGGSLSYKLIACYGLSPLSDDIEVISPGASALMYDGSQYHQNWKTPAGAGKCYSLTATIIDGSSITAYFKTK